MCDRHSKEILENRLGYYECKCHMLFEDIESLEKHVKKRHPEELVNTKPNNKIKKNKFSPY